MTHEEHDEACRLSRKLTATTFFDLMDQARRYCGVILPLTAEGLALGSLVKQCGGRVIYDVE